MYLRGPNSSSTFLGSSPSRLKQCAFCYISMGPDVDETEQGRYDAAMRDYKKGKFLLESRPGQLLPIGSKDGQASVAEEQQQKRILEKVWGSVEKAMNEMRNTLLSQLQDPSRSVEEQENTIE